MCLHVAAGGIMWVTPEELMDGEADDCLITPEGDLVMFTNLEDADENAYVSRTQVSLATVVHIVGPPSEELLAGLRTSIRAVLFGGMMPQ